MAYRLEDGKGTRGKSSVFQNRLRTFDVKSSLVNYESVKSGNITQDQILNGEVIGTFVARNTANFTILNAKAVGLSLTNIDPINLMIIDRVYFQVTFSSQVLNINSAVAIDNLSGGSSILPIINENRYSTITPLVVARGSGSSISATIGSNIPFIYPSLGVDIELIPPNLDGIVLSGLPKNTSDTSSPNTFSVVIFSSFGFFVQYICNIFIRFLMVHPGDTG